MTDIILAIVIAIIAATPGLYAIFAQRGKDRADVAEKYEQMAGRAVEQIDQLKKRVDDLEKQVEELQRTERTYRGGIDLLISQIESRGMTPIWKPEAKGGDG